MKEKIFQALKQSYPQFGLGDNVLTAFAEMLEATGVVTDDTLADVVAKQHTALEAIQKANDKRAADAAAKAAKEAEAKAKAEAEALRKKQEAEAAKQALKQSEKQNENAKTNADNHEEENEIPEWFKAQQSAFEQRMQEAMARNEELSKSLQAVKEENDNFRSEQAAAKRSAFIASEAKRLGVPEWRSSEGFNIASDADEQAITEYLTKVSNNVKANMLPENKSGFPQFKDEATPEEIAAIAKSILK